MELKVHKTDSIEGVIKAPPSKSYSHRAFIIASLAKGESLINYPLYSEDTMASLKACQAFGSQAEINDNFCKVQGTGGNLKTPEDVLNLENSGTTLRILTTMASLAPGCTVLTGDYSLRERPMQKLLDSLKNLGVNAYSTRDNGLPPIVIKNGFKGGATEISGHVSSQYISSILISAPYAESPVEVQVVGEFVSKPYVDMTLNIMEKFNVHVEQETPNHFYVENQTYIARDYTVEGDYSSASYIVAAAAILEGEVTIKNLFKNSKQGDKVILDIVDQMGASVKQKDENVTIKGSGELQGLDINLENSPDLLPTVAALASVSNGKTHIKGVEHARYKETDRVHTMAKELSKLGVRLTEEPDGLIIHGGARGGVVESHSDHRLVMALSLVGLKVGNVLIKNAHVYQVSFPDFHQLMVDLGCQMNVSP